MLFQRLRPKVLLFDIGGVCLKSPFQAILDFELASGIPPGWVNYAISRNSPNGAWQQIERGEVPLDQAWYAAFKRELEDPESWKAYNIKLNGESKEVPPVPTIDGESLFGQMMGGARATDPHMFPALQKLNTSGQFIMGALSNTVIFPPEHPYSAPHSSKAELTAQFDVFISSAHVGMRKPDRKIYDFAVKELDAFDRARGGTGVTAGDITFLDDIGENLKTARSLGMGTIKVFLGHVKNAVKELETVTGLSLLEEEERAKL